MQLDSKKLRFKKHKYRTLEIAPLGTISSDSRVITVDLKPDATLDPLVNWCLGSITAVFLFLSLDSVTNSQTVRNWIIDSMNWGTLYLPFFPNRFWAPVTSMWFHGSWEHLFGNMVGFYVAALWLSRVYDSKAWRYFFFLGGPLAGIIFVYLNHCPPADFAHWHGSLAAITGEPNTPLAGASGGIFAMIGATLAAALRYRIVGIKSWMQVSVPFLLALPLLQFLFVDWGNSGIAGLAHELALVFGFILGLFPRLKGAVTIITSCPEAIGVDSVTVDDRYKQTVGACYYVLPLFDDEKDFLLKKQDFIGYKSIPAYKLLGGKRPVEGAIGYVVPLHVVASKLPDEVYKNILLKTRRAWVTAAIYIVLISAVSQWLFAKYSAPNYPSIFLANILFGVIMMIESFLGLKIFLQWQPPQQAVVDGSPRSGTEFKLPLGSWMAV